MKNLLKVELEKRMKERQFASKLYAETTKGHIYKDEEGLNYLDPNFFNDERFKNVDMTLKMSGIKLLVLREYIKDCSGLEFDGVLLKTLEEEIEEYNQQYDGNPLADFIDIKTKERLTYIMGERFSLDVMQDKTPEEMKEIYYSMITNSMLTKGLTSEQINEWINEVAISIGGKEKSETKKM